MGVQQFVCLVAARLAEILLVNLLDGGVFVGLAYDLALILAVKRLGAQSPDVGCGKLLCTQYGWPPPVTQPPGQP